MLLLLLSLRKNKWLLLSWKGDDREKHFQLIRIHINETLKKAKETGEKRKKKREKQSTEKKKKETREHKKKMDKSK